MTCISRQGNRNRETDAPAASALFELVAEHETQPCTAIISLSTEVDCERETEPFPSTAPGVVNDDELNDDVIVLCENFPGRDTDPRYAAAA